MCFEVGVIFNPCPMSFEFLATRFNIAQNLRRMVLVTSPFMFLIPWNPSLFQTLYVYRQTNVAKEVNRELLEVMELRSG
jgi:hypothetical protein